MSIYQIVMLSVSSVCALCALVYCLTCLISWISVKVSKNKAKRLAIKQDKMRKMYLELKDLFEVKK